MTEEAARRELMDRAGIEFDPGVVNAFLSLDRFDELDSFAKIGDEPPPEVVEGKSRAWDLFSPFRSS